MTYIGHIRTLRLIVLSMVLGALGIGEALSAGPGVSPQTAIAARKGGFKKMGAAMRTLNVQLKAGAPSHPEMAKAAQELALASRQQLRLFPAGSGASAGVPTAALPEVWKDRKAFDAQMARMVQESSRLAALTKGRDIVAIQAQVKVTGAVCSACHRQFRSND